MFTIFCLYSFANLIFGIWALIQAVRASQFAPAYLLVFIACLHIGGGGLATGIMLPKDDFEVYLASQDIDTSSLVVGNLLLTIWCVVLLFLAHQWRRLINIEDALLQRRCDLGVSTVEFLVFALVVFSLEAVFFYMEQQRFGAYQVMSEYEINPVTQILYFLRVSLAATCIIRLGQGRWRTAEVIVLATELVLIAMNGRRLLFIVVTFGLYWLLRRGISFRKLWLVGAIGVVMLLFGARLFLALRLVREERGDIPISEQVWTAAEAFWFGETEKGTSVTRSLQRNLEVRPSFAICYLGILVTKAAGHTPALGRAVTNEVSRAVPRIMFPGKDSIIRIGGSEGIAESLFGITPEDRANTLIAAGYVDFKVLFAVSTIYVLVCLIAMRYCLLKTPPGFFFVASCGPYLFAILEFEQDIAGYCVGLRLMAMALLGGAVYGLMKKSVKGGSLEAKAFER